MTIARRTVLQGMLGAAALGLTGARPGFGAEGGAGPGFGAEGGTGKVIRIGDINSYSRIPAFTDPYRKGWTLALDEINAQGGVAGAKLEVLSRDDGGKPGDALTMANQLVAGEGVALLMGAYLSNVGLALSDFAAHRNVPYLAAEPLSDALVWSHGNAQTFRLRPSTTMQAAMLVEEAARLPAKRWATIAPNYEYGQSAVAAFKKLLKAKRPDVTFVEEQWPPLFKIDAGASVQALAHQNPDAIFNVTFGADLAQFVREGSLRGLFTDRPVVSLLTGEPEYLEPLGKDAPIGWIVTGYPWADISTPEHRAFVAAYQAKFSQHPYLGSLVGYITMHSVAAALTKAKGSTRPEAIIAALSGLELPTPLGQIRYRAADHQSTMGAFVGRTALREGKPVMVDWYYAPGDKFLPSPEEAAKLRPKA